MGFRKKMETEERKKDFLQTTASPIVFWIPARLNSRLKELLQKQEEKQVEKVKQLLEQQAL